MNTAAIARRIIAEWAKSGDTETLFHLIDDELRHLVAIIGGQQITIAAQQDVMQKGSMKIIIHEIATDGLPNMDKLVGRVAFLFDGCIVSGWPIDENADPVLWEADSDVGHGRAFYEVTHWVEFPEPLSSIR
jgi:hypothetical protein